MLYPPSLVSRLNSDASSHERGLSSPGSPDPSASRDLTARKLLYLAPLAADTLGDCLSSGEPKDRRAAAEAILDRAPIGLAAPPPMTDRSLPPSLVSALSSALSSFASAFAALAPVPVPPALDPVTVILPPKELAVTSDPLPDPTLPPIPPDTQMTSKGLAERKRKKSPSSSKRKPSSPAKKARK